MRVDLQALDIAAMICQFLLLLAIAGAETVDFNLVPLQRLAMKLDCGEENAG